MAAHFAGGGGAAFRQFCNDVSTIGLAGLREQFAELRNYQPSDPSRSAFDANMAKNRYKDVICLDSSRVVLKPLPSEPPLSSDYIHANSVYFDVLKYRFICAQGPLDSTTHDFWRMIWQEKVVHVFMLCRCEELGKPKCAQYWPKQEGAIMNFGGFTIRNDKVHYPDKNIVATNMTVTYQGETRGIDHRQWITWPDKTVPRTLDTAFKMLTLIRDRKTPTLVHCSAGIGRTGTLVAIDVLYRYLMANKPMSLKTVVEGIRNQRGQAVQTEDQYLFIHYVILQRIASRGFIEYGLVKNFCHNYETYILQLTKTPQEPLIRLPNTVPANYQPPSTILAAYKTAIATMKTKSSSQATQSSGFLSSVEKEKVPKRGAKTRRSGGTRRDRNRTRRTRSTTPSKKPLPEPGATRASAEAFADEEPKKAEWDLQLAEAGKLYRIVEKPKCSTPTKCRAERSLGPDAQPTTTTRSEPFDYSLEPKESGAASKVKEANSHPKPVVMYDADYEEPESVFAEDSMARDAAKEPFVMNPHTEKEISEAKADGVDPLLFEAQEPDEGRKNSKEYTELNRYLALQQKFREYEKKAASENEQRKQ
uniref:Protein-tyrosine-phosphatase n=1 Tax=Steinernema glaseri TaxID=37863 RepID=A0A1I7YBS8_9BILA